MPIRLLRLPLWRSIVQDERQICGAFPQTSQRHRPLIGHSWQASCLWAMALKPAANQYTGPAFSTKACFMVVGDITASVNKGRRVGPMSSLLIWMSMGISLPLQKSMVQDERQTCEEFHLIVGCSCLRLRGWMSWPAKTNDNNGFLLLGCRSCTSSNLTQRQQKNSLNHIGWRLASSRKLNIYFTI